MYNNDSFKKVKAPPDVVDYFKELPFYNKHNEKPKIRRLKSINAFRGYAMSYIVEIIEKKKRSNYTVRTK